MHLHAADGAFHLSTKAGALYLHSCPNCRPDAFPRAQRRSESSCSRSPQSSGKTTLKMEDQFQHTQNTFNGADRSRCETVLNGPGSSAGDPRDGRACARSVGGPIYIHVPSHSIPACVCTRIPLFYSSAKRKPRVAVRLPAPAFSQ